MVFKLRSIFAEFLFVRQTYKKKHYGNDLPEIFAKPAQIGVMSFDEQETNIFKIFFY